MKIFEIIVIAILLAIQIAGMVWAWRYVSKVGAGDSETSLKTKLLWTVLWPMTWCLSWIGAVQ